MTIWRMRIACCITKATNTESEYVIFLLSHCNNVRTNAPQCYVIRTLSVSFITETKCVYCAVRAVYIYVGLFVCFPGVTTHCGCIFIAR